VRVNIDPVNLLADVRMLYESAVHARRVLDVLGDVAVSGHVKDASVGDDFVVHISEVPLGEGTYDVRGFVEEFTRRLPQAPLFIEHLPAALVPRAKATLDEILAPTALEARGA
jgi:hypothetical protein